MGNNDFKHTKYNNIQTDTYIFLYRIWNKIAEMYSYLFNRFALPDRTTSWVNSNLTWQKHPLDREYESLFE